jgi:hypothetical protein
MTPRDITNPKISPVKLALRAYSVTLSGVDTILRLGWLAALLLSAVQLFVVLTPPEVSEDGTEILFAPGEMATFVVMAVVGFGIQTMVAVGWHRAILLGESHAERRFYLRFGRAEMLYSVVVVVLLLFFTMGMGMLPAAIEMYGSASIPLALFFLAGPILSTLVVARISLVLPSIATGGPCDIRQSWQASQGNGARLAALYLLVGVPLAAAQFLLPVLLSSVASLGLGALGDVVISFVGTLVMLIVLCTLISAISLAYRELGGLKPVA